MKTCDSHLETCVCEDTHSHTYSHKYMDIRGKKTSDKGWSLNPPGPHGTVHLSDHSCEEESSGYKLCSWASQSDRRSDWPTCLISSVLLTAVIKPAYWGLKS